MATSSFRFIKGNTYQLRAIQVTTDKQGKLMASEPKGPKDAEGPIAMALDDTGGECWCQIDGHDAPVRVHPNKVVGTEACAKYVTGLKGAQPRGDSQPSISLAKDPIGALKAAKARIEAATKAKENAEQDYRELIKQAQAFAKAAEEALIEQDELEAETTFEQANA